MHFYSSRFIIHILFVFLPVLIQAQSKKEQIDILNQQTDSLNRVIQMKNTEIDALSEQLLQINQINDQQREKLSVLEIKLNELSVAQSGMLKKIDSLQKVQLSLSPFSTKRQILTHLIGNHFFVEASGFFGANTLTEIIPNEQGGFTDVTSSIMDGQREAWTTPIDKKGENFLKEFHIEVDSFLNVKLKTGSSTVFTVPFKENGMVYDVKEVGKELHEHLTELNSGTNFFEDRLYIVAKNEFDISHIFPDQVSLIGDDVMTLSYSLFGGEFYLEFFYNDCCDNNTIIFRRHM